MTQLLQPSVPVVAAFPTSPAEGQFVIIRSPSNLPQLFQYTAANGWLSVSKSIQDEGVFLPQRPTMNFVGKMVDASDDSANSRTQVKVFEPLNLWSAVGGNGGYVSTNWQEFGLSVSFTPDRQCAAYINWNMRIDSTVAAWTYMQTMVGAAAASDWSLGGSNLCWGYGGAISYSTHTGFTAIACRANVAQRIYIVGATNSASNWVWVNGSVNYMTVALVPY